MALSRHSICNNLPWALHELSYPCTSESEYYNYKLQAALGSLPQDFDETQMWTEYGNPHPAIETHYRAADRIICYTAHSNEQLAEELNSHPDARIIKLVNHHRFNQLCFGLKSKTSLVRQKLAAVYGDELALPDHLKLCPEVLFASPEEYQTETRKLSNQHRARALHWDRSSPPGHFEFDMDTVYSSDAFLLEMRRLYDFLDMDDFKPELIQEFHRAYLKLHRIG